MSQVIRVISAPGLRVKPWGKDGKKHLVKGEHLDANGFSALPSNKTIPSLLKGFVLYLNGYHLHSAQLPLGLGEICFKQVNPLWLYGHKVFVIWTLQIILNVQSTSFEQRNGISWFTFLWKFTKAINFGETLEVKMLIRKVLQWSFWEVMVAWPHLQDRQRLGVGVRFRMYFANVTKTLLTNCVCTGCLGEVYMTYSGKLSELP